MEFLNIKETGMIPFILSQILDASIDGITLSDPEMQDNPIVYANEAFKLIPGYNRDERQQVPIDKHPPMRDFIRATRAQH